MTRRWAFITAAALLLAAATDHLLLGGDQAESWWSRISGFFALFGLVSCGALILASKALGHYFLDRNEEYYGRDSGEW